MARIGILALQGAFIEHERMLREMGAECIEIRNKKQLAEPISGLVLPGGESTVQRKLLIEEGLLQPLKEKSKGEFRSSPPAPASSSSPRKSKEETRSASAPFPSR